MPPFALSANRLHAAIPGFGMDPDARLTGTVHRQRVCLKCGPPLHANAAGIMPLVEALFDKGPPMGTLLAFMMAVVALNLPELILLRWVLKPPLLAAFVGVTATGLVTIGYLFNLFLV